MASNAPPRVLTAEAEAEAEADDEADDEADALAEQGPGLRCIDVCFWEFAPVPSKRGAFDTNAPALLGPVPSASLSAGTAKRTRTCAPDGGAMVQFVGKARRSNVRTSSCRSVDKHKDRDKDTDTDKGKGKGQGELLLGLGNVRMR